jgi:hypothetical protein
MLLAVDFERKCVTCYVLADRVTRLWLNPGGPSAQLQTTRNVTRATPSLPIVCQHALCEGPQYRHRSREPELDLREVITSHIPLASTKGLTPM